eukprot:1161226-Pelagomonas_calceolata.AAC.10
MALFPHATIRTTFCSYALFHLCKTQCRQLRTVRMQPLQPTKREATSNLPNCALSIDPNAINHNFSCKRGLAGAKTQQARRQASFQFAFTASIPSAPNPRLGLPFVTLNSLGE